MNTEAVTLTSATNDVLWSFTCGKCPVMFDDAKTWAQHQVEEHGARFV